MSETSTMKRHTVKTQTLFQWHNFIRDSIDGNYTMAIFWFNEIDRDKNRYSKDFNSTWNEYKNSIDYCLNDLKDNAMGSSVEMSSIPVSIL